MKVWILTEEHNEYDQYGEYFISAFKEKPTHKQLTELDVPTNRLKYVLGGGGRQDGDCHWYHLREVEAK